MKFLDLLNTPVTFRRRPVDSGPQDKTTGQTDELATAGASLQPACAGSDHGSEHPSHAAPGAAAAAAGLVAAAAAGPAATPARAEPQQALLAQHIDEAALLFATEQPDSAARLLSTALVMPQPHAGEIERRAWWMLLELHQARGKQADFDRAALAYAQRYEASPPQWTAPREEPQLRVRESTSAAPLLLGLRGALTADAQPTLLQWQQRSATATDINIDLAQVSSVDLTGCHLLLDLFADWQQRGTQVQLRACDGLRAMLHALIQSGRRDADDAGWRLLIELLRLAGDVERYEDACLAYSLTFEISPPAAPPPVIDDFSRHATGTRAIPRHRTGAGTAASTAAGKAATVFGDTGTGAGAGAGAISSAGSGAGSSANTSSSASVGTRANPTLATAAFALPEVITMPVDALLVALRAHIRNADVGTPALVLDAHRLQRIDFHAASVIQSALDELAAGKPVEWQGVSFLVSTLLQLTCGSAVPRIINRMP